jgi:hypothetical protein
MTTVSLTLNYMTCLDVNISNSRIFAGTDRVLHLNNLKPPIELGNEVRGPRERHSTSSNKGPPQSGIFSNVLTKRLTL